MLKNIGTIDKAVRVVLAVTVAVLFFTKVITGLAAILLAALALVLLATVFVGTCPVYLPFGISSKKKA